MRYLTLLQREDPDANITYSPTETEPHFYNENLHDKYMIMTNLYKSDSELQKYYREIVKFSHPFEYIVSEVKTRFIPNNKMMKITNAYMKMFEFLRWITNMDNHGTKPILNIKDNLNMFDVAGAPGMFVIATDNFLNKYFPNTSLNWMTCSLEGGTALTDQYKLYQNNPSRYIPCDVSKEEDIKRCIKDAKIKYQLVTGDIGIYHEDNYDKLQEENQLDIEWGQMVLSLNLCEEHGIMFLKMYSMITKETIYLLDILTCYFDKVYITKPYTTRIFNDESYIICIDRNDKDISHIPLHRPYIKDYKSDNIALVASFEYSRLDIKSRMVSLIKRMIVNYPSIKLNDVKKNHIYKIFYDEFADIFDEFVEMDERNKNK